MVRNMTIDFFLSFNCLHGVRLYCRTNKIKSIYFNVTADLFCPKIFSPLKKINKTPETADAFAEKCSCINCQNGGKTIVFREHIFSSEFRYNISYVVLYFVRKTNSFKLLFYLILWVSSSSQLTECQKLDIL